VKEQVKEERVEREEAEEEIYRRLREARRARSVSKPELAPRVEEQPPKLQAPPAKPRITFSIPIKSVKQLGFSQPQTPRLKANPPRFVKPKLLSVEAQPTALITPIISIAPKAMDLKDVRVPTLAPATIRRLTAPPLRLRLKAPSDISVRPIIRSEPIRDMGTLIPIIKPTRVVFQRPSISSTPLEHSIVHLPRIRVIPLVKEEIERVIYKLKRMGFSEELIAECLNRVYGASLSLEEISGVIEKGEKGQIALIECLPKEVGDAINALLAEKRQTSVVPEPSAEVDAMVIPEVFELFLEERSGKGIGGAFSYSEEPVYIVLAKPYDSEYECLDTLHYLCIRTLREHLGILSETRLLSSEYGRYEVERHLGEREITIVDEKTLSDKLVLELKKPAGDPLLELALELNEEALADRIKDIGKGFRYVIFHVRQDLAGLLYDKLWRIRSKFHDKIFWVEPRALPTDLRRRLAELMWAFVDVQSTGSYDSLFGDRKNAYYRKLSSIGEVVRCNPERPYPIVRTHRSGPESWEHYLLKNFLAKCLVDKPPQELELSRIAREERYKHIEFEKEWWKENQLVAVSDVYIESDGVAVEVETLFEEGKYGGDPVAKIRDETVEKYRRFEIPIRELWVVLENITMLRHLRELWALRNLYKRQHEEGSLSFEVKFFTLDLKSETLFQMEELVKCAREILKARSSEYEGVGWR
jgi:hypothetical protein